jgi:pilus assembly protein CpaC
MKHIFIILILLSGPIHSSADPQILVLGEELRLTGHESRIWIANPKILKAVSMGGRLVLKPLKEGLVDVRINSTEKQFAILSPAAARTWTAMQKVAGLIVGADASLVEGRPSLTGRLHRIEDYDEILRALPQDADWDLRSALSPKMQSQVSARITKTAGLSTSPALVFGEVAEWRFFGSVEDAKLMQKRLRAFGIRVIRDESAVDTAPMVKVEIAVAEVRRDAMKSYGIGWPQSAEAKLLADGKWQGSELVFNAKAFESAGQGRLLARPSLLCRSGKEAEFMAGGEFPIKVISTRMQEIIWKKYGILVRVKPKADSSGRMSLALDVEISTIDGSRTVDGVPGMLTNRVSSHFDLQRPRVIALSGLVKQEDSNSREGLLGLSRLPIIGSLFSSRDWRENRTELVIFVRPEIVKEDSP